MMSDFKTIQFKYSHNRQEDMIDLCPYGLLGAVEPMGSYGVKSQQPVEKHRFRLSLIT